MSQIDEIRAKFPQYAEVSDGDLLLAVHRKFYPSMHVKSFLEKVDPDGSFRQTVSREMWNGYYAEAVAKPQEGETEEDAKKRAYGSLSTGKDNAQVLRNMNPQLVTGGAAASLLRGIPFVGSYVDDVIGRFSGPEKAARYEVMRKNFDELNPKSATALQIAGAITGAAPALLAATKATAIAPTSMIGRGALGLFGGGALGAAEGGVYGAGDGETAQERVRNSKNAAAIGGLLGGGFGIAIPAMGKGIGKGVEFYRNHRGAKRTAEEAGMPLPTAQIIARSLSADGALSGQGRAAISRGGPDAMLADAGPSSQALLDYAMQTGGEAATQANRAINQRATRANETIQHALDEALGEAQGLNQGARDIAERTRAERASAYQAAYDTPIDFAGPGREIEEVLARIPDRVKREAVRRANEQMQAAGRVNQQIVADVTDDGSVTFREMPNVEQLDQLKRVLGAMGVENVDQFGRRTTDGNMYSGLASDLRNSIGNAVPGYADAVRLGGDKIAEDNALSLGGRLLKPSTTREEVAQAVENYGPAERQAIAQGMRSTFDETLANVKRSVGDANMDAQEAIRGLRDLSSRAAKDKVQTAIGPTKAAALARALEEAGAGLSLRAATSGNSKTFARQNMNETLDQQVRENPLVKVLNLRPMEAAREITSDMLGNLPQKRQAAKEKALEDIVKVLTGPAGAAAKRTLAATRKVSGQLSKNEDRRTRLEALFTHQIAPTAYLGTTQLTR